MLALAYHEHGKNEDACYHRERMMEMAVGASYLEYISGLISAAMSLEDGRDDACAVLLRRAMAIGAEHGYLNFAWWQPRVMARLCVRALEKGIEPAYVQRLIRTRNLVPDEAPVHLQNWPWPVRIATLGSFSLEVAGEPVVFSGKVQKKPLEMLTCALECRRAPLLPVLDWQRTSPGGHRLAQPCSRSRWHG